MNIIQLNDIVGYLLDGKPHFTYFGGSTGKDTSDVIILLNPLNSINDEVLQDLSMGFRMWYKNPNFNYKLMSYSDIEICHKAQIDYRGLIDKGLAKAIEHNK